LVLWACKERYLHGRSPCPPRASGLHRSKPRLTSSSYPNCQSSCSLGPSIAEGYLTKAARPSPRPSSRQPWPSRPKRRRSFGPFALKRTLSHGRSPCPPRLRTQVRPPSGSGY
jgi:hypothetical protein